MLVSACLFASPTAKAQTTIWSATLTPKNTVSTYVGCLEGTDTSVKCDNSSVLTDDDFTHESVEYHIRAFHGIPTSLNVQLDKAFPSGLTLIVGTAELTLASASLSTDGRTANWSLSSAVLFLNQQISLRLVKPAAPTFTEYTVTLTADNQEPPEGSTVTLTATLDKPAVVIMGGKEETLHFIKARGSALAGSDFRWSEPGGGPTITEDIEINEGETTFTAMLEVIDDGEAEDDETIEIWVGSSLTLTNNPILTLTIPANTGSTDNTPTDDTPADRQPSPTVSVPTTGGDPPPAEPSDPDSPLCGESDREDLESFYEASGGDNWLENENWKSTEPLDQWHGVETDEDRNVVSLRLPDNNLSGDMPKEELQCLTELVELALWGNDDLMGEVPEELVLAVEREVLRDIAEMLDINPEWFEDYKDPYDFEDWHEGVTTDDEGRVTGLDFTGEGVIEEIPKSVSELQRLRDIMRTTSEGGCALSPKGDSSAFSLFLLTLVVFAALGRIRAWD